MAKAFTASPFKDAVAPTPSNDGDWSLTLGAKIPDAPAADGDALQGGDTAQIQDAPKPGANVGQTRLPGS